MLLRDFFIASDDDRLYRIFLQWLDYISTFLCFKTCRLYFNENEMCKLMMPMIFVANSGVGRLNCVCRVIRHVAIGGPRNNFKPCPNIERKNSLWSNKIAKCHFITVSVITGLVEMCSRLNASRCLDYPHLNRIFYATVTKLLRLLEVKIIARKGNKL